MDKYRYELTEISYKDLQLIKDALHENLPETLTIHGLADIHLRYGSFSEAMPKFYFAINSNFKSFCCVTSLATSNIIQTFTAYWDSNEISEEDVSKLFSNIPGWNWNFPFAFFVSSHQIKLIFDSLIEKGLIQTELQIEKNIEKSSSKGIIFSLAEEDLIEPKIPPGYVIKQLPSSAASKILSTWGYNFAETEKGLAERISIMEGIGMFRTDSSTEDSDNLNSLVAWTSQYMNGVIGMTFTLPEERRKGLAGALTLTLAKKIIAEGRIPYVMTEITNTYSCKFHQNLGFKIIGHSGASLYLPEGLTVMDLHSK